jgi:hypothetical protein
MENGLSLLDARNKNGKTISTAVPSGPLAAGNPNAASLSRLSARQQLHLSAQPDQSRLQEQQSKPGKKKLPQSNFRQGKKC